MSNSSPPLLKVENLQCQFPQCTLYQGLGFQVEVGSMLLVSGPNGCGKTSLLRQICGLLPLDEGATFFWQGQRCQPEDYSHQLTYCGHRFGVDERLTVRENLIQMSSFSPNGSLEAIDAVLPKIGLQQIAEKIVSHLSAGQKKRLSLGRLLLYKTLLWVLDEPFNALDQEAIEQLQQWLQEHISRGGSVVLTSHQADALNMEPTTSLALDSWR